MSDRPDSRTIRDIQDRVARGEIDLRDVGELLTGRWDQDFPAELLSLALSAATARDGEPIGYARSGDLVPAREARSVTAPWCNNQKNAHYDTPLYTTPQQEPAKAPAAKSQATFTISLFEQRSQLHVDAAYGDPATLLRRALEVLEIEERALAACPAHQEPAEATDGVEELDMRRLGADFEDEDVVAAMQHIAGCDHDDMVAACEAFLLSRARRRAALTAAPAEGGEPVVTDQTWPMLAALLSIVYQSFDSGGESSRSQRSLALEAVLDAIVQTIRPLERFFEAKRECEADPWAYISKARLILTAIHTTPQQEPAKAPGGVGVKRYELEAFEDRDDMVERPHGSWVWFDDVAALTVPQTDPLSAVPQGQTLPAAAALKNARKEGER